MIATGQRLESSRTRLSVDHPDGVDLTELGPLRVLALGQESRMAVPVRGVLWCTDPGEAHDVVLLRGPMGAAHLAAYRLTSASPAALIAVSEPQDDVRHDVVISTDLTVLADHLQPFISTIARLRTLATHHDRAGPGGNAGAGGRGHPRT